jgi:short-subunit dehydrogenase
MKNLEYRLSQKSLKGKTALITGASSGIGEALARELIQRVAIVIGVGRSQEKLEILSNDLGEKFVPMVCDVSCQDSVENLFTKLTARNLFPEVWFLNAGMAGEQVVELSGFDLQKHQEIMAVNYFGVLYCVNQWHKRGCPPAQFIVTSSVNAVWAPPKGSAYAASKAAISKAFEGLAASFYKSGSQFSSIYCGPVRTKGLKGSFPFTWSPEKMATYLADFAEGKKRREYPSVFYYCVAHLFKSLLHGWMSKWLG